LKPALIWHGTHQDPGVPGFAYYDPDMAKLPNEKSSFCENCYWHAPGIFRHTPYCGLVGGLPRVPVEGVPSPGFTILAMQPGREADIQASRALGWGTTSDIRGVSTDAGTAMMAVQNMTQNPFSKLSPAHFWSMMRLLAVGVHESSRETTLRKLSWPEALGTLGPEGFSMAVVRSLMLSALKEGLPPYDIPWQNPALVAIPIEEPDDEF
jgi:hypothetical protein